MYCSTSYPLSSVFFSAVNQCLWLQLPCGSHKTTEAGGRAFPSAKGKAEDEWTFPPHWRLVNVYNSYGARKISLQQLCVICSCNQNWLNLAEIWLDWLKDEIRLTEEEPNREKVYELFEKAAKDYICECSAHLLLPMIGYSVITDCNIYSCVLIPRSRYLAWVCSVFNWWHGLTGWDRQGEIHLWESRDSCGTSHDQGTYSVGGIQRVWECHSVHSTGLCFHH